MTTVLRNPLAIGRVTVGAPGRGHLLAEGEQASLLEAASHRRRDVVIMLLALRAGVDAREQSRMNVGHVCSGGSEVANFVIIPGRRGVLDPELPVGAVPISEGVRRDLGSLVEATKARCRHGEGRFGKDVSEDGVSVCHVCRLPLDLNRAPLLLNRSGGRLSERQIQKLFVQARDRAGLGSDHTFGSLVRTYEARVRALVLRAVRDEL